MAVEFLEATTENAFVRMALVGPTGSGKTLTALRLARGFGGKVVVIDTEHNTARLFKNHSDVPQPYYVYNLKKFVPDAYCLVIDKALEFGANVCIIDSITHAWNGKDGILEMVDGDIRGWKVGTPQYRKLIDKLIGQNERMHMIVTIRSKMDYALEISPKTGRMEVTKHGMKPIQRDEFTYEFDIVGQLDQDHTLSFDGVGKQRFPALDGKRFEKPGSEVAELILSSLASGGQEV